MTDSAYPPFRTGNEALTGLVLFPLIMPPQLWFRAAVADALTMLCTDRLWQKVGSVEISDAVQASLEMFDRWLPMYGVIFPYAGSTAPAGTLLCDGTGYNTADYPNLFAAIGYTFGGSGGTFNVPDMRGRSPIGAGSGSGLTPRSIGDAIGSETHTLITGEIPSHSHADSGHTHADGIAAPTAILVGAGAPAPSAIPAVGVSGVGYASIGNAGGDGSHNNMQPSLALSFVIVAG